MSDFYLLQVKGLGITALCLMLWQQGHDHIHTGKYIGEVVPTFIMMALPTALDRTIKAIKAKFVGLQLTCLKQRRVYTCTVCVWQSQ